MNSEQITPSPIVKWAGGKSQLIGQFEELFPKNITSYCEPFLGGGGVLFHLSPVTAYINDINSELMNMYMCVRDCVDDLIAELRTHTNDSVHYYEVRDWDRDKEAYANLSPVKKAARMLYLNKTCFNGLYRVNGKGCFNTSFGKNANPDIVNENGLRAVSRYFNTADIKFYCGDYSTVLDLIPENTFVYLDPPYDPVSETSNFVNYDKRRFLREDHVRLKEYCDKLTQKGVKFMLSNSPTDFIRELYHGYNIETVRARRRVNSDARKRGCVDELVIRNYE